VKRSNKCLDPPFRVIRSLRCRRLRVEGSLIVPDGREVAEPPNFATAAR
jgi:hypothetical protein